jgi:hypothetical protein
MKLPKICVDSSVRWRHGTVIRSKLERVNRNCYEDRMKRGSGGRLRWRVLVQRENEWKLLAEGKKIPPFPPRIERYPANNDAHAPRTENESVN